MATIFMAMTPASDTLPGRFQELRHEGESGTVGYMLYEPATRSGDELPLVVMLHGCTQTPADFAEGTRMNQLAEERDFLVLYPDQPDSAHPQRCWRWYDPAHQTRDAGEPASIVELVREVQRAHRVDPDRIYVVGISAGGAMTAVLSAEYPELFAAAAVHSGAAHGIARTVADALQVMRVGPPAEWAPKPASRAAHSPPVPALLIHGDADAVLSPLNLEALAAQWAALSRAAGFPTTREAPDGTGRARLIAGDHLVAEIWMIPGLGHAWSGGSATGSFTAPELPDATTAIVDFLLARSRHP